MKMKAMQKIYGPRYPTSNAGFIFIAISIFFSLLTLAFFVVTIANQHRRGEPGDGTFNWPFLFITVVASFLLFGLSLVGLRKFLQNEPRRVTIDEQGMMVEKVSRRNRPGVVEVEIPFAKLISVDQEDKIVASEEAKGGFRFKGLLVQWQAENSDEPQIYRLSERDIVEFDLLLDDVFTYAPEAARGLRIFDR